MRATRGTRPYRGVFAWSLVGLILSGNPSSSLIAYDCSPKGALYEVIDLLQPGSCPDPVRDFEDPAPQAVAVYQQETSASVTGYLCRVTYDKRVTRCGFDHLTYGSTWSVWGGIADLTPGECREAVKQGFLTFEGRLFSAKPGISQKYHFFSHGSTDASGRCARSPAPG